MTEYFGDPRMGELISRRLELQRELARAPGVLPELPLHDDALVTSLSFDLFEVEDEEAEEGASVRGSVPKTISLVPNKRHVKTRDGREFMIEDSQALIDDVRANGIDLVIGADHDEVGSIFASAPAPARGWIDHKVGLRRKGKFGIVGDVEWTDIGRQAIESKEFRYISPVLDIPGMFAFLWDDGDVPTLEGIVAASIVNIPALRMPSLNSRHPHVARGTVTMNEELRKQLCAALGLPEDAKLETIFAACEAKAPTVESIEGTAGAELDLTQWVPRAEFDALAERFTEVETAASSGRIDDAIARNRKRIQSPEYEKVLREQLASGALSFEAFDSLMEATPESRLTSEDATDGAHVVDVGALGLDEAAVAFCEEHKIDPKDFADRLKKRQTRRLHRVI